MLFFLRTSLRATLSVLKGDLMPAVLELLRFLPEVSTNSDCTTTTFCSCLSPPPSFSARCGSPTGSYLSRSQLPLELMSTFILEPSTSSPCSAHMFLFLCSSLAHSTCWACSKCALHHSILHLLLLAAPSQGHFCNLGPVWCGKPRPLSILFSRPILVLP